MLWLKPAIHGRSRILLRGATCHKGAFSLHEGAPPIVYGSFLIESCAHWPATAPFPSKVTPFRPVSVSSDHRRCSPHLQWHLSDKKWRPACLLWPPLTRKICFARPWWCPSDNKWCHDLARDDILSTRMPFRRVTTLFYIRHWHWPSARRQG